MKLTKLTTLTTLILLLVYNSMCCVAQGGREFWFAAPQVSAKHGNTPILLRISTFDKPALISISEPANPSFQPITISISANSLQTVNLTDRVKSIETAPADAILKTGLFIKASNEISVYYEVLGFQNYNPIDTDFVDLDANNSDIFVLKGNAALGNNFFIPMQNYWGNYYPDNAWSSFDIVATENNTQITITPTQDLVGHVKHIPFSKFLNKGETYSARADSGKNGINQHWRGNLHATASKVVADKPITITYKDDSDWDQSVNPQHWDLVGDQLIPVEAVGTEYIAVKASGAAQTDRVFICATQGNTQLFIKNDTINLPLDSTFDYHLIDSVVYIQSSAPVYAFHVSAFGHELGGAILPPVTCTGSKNIVFVRSNHEPFALNILAKTGSENDFVLTGSAITVPADSFRTVPGTNGNWKYAQIVFPDYYDTESNNLEPEKAFTLKNATSDFHLGTLNGGAVTGFRYGYFSGFGSVNLTPQSFICQGDSLLLDAGLNKDSYMWSTGATTSYITVKDTGLYYVTVKKATCSFSDSTHVQFYQPVTGKILGNDTSSCSNVPITIKALNTFSSYLWQDNSTTLTYTPIMTGDYILQVSNENGCHKSDTLHFLSKPIPQPVIVYQGSLEQFCNDSLARLGVNTAYQSYRWYNGYTTQNITTKYSQDNNYSVSVTDQEGCSNSTSVIIDCSHYIKIPNVFTPNGDNVNDQFRIHNLNLNQWKLVIYDRWGVQVFNANPYQNNWQADALPDGIYLYQLTNMETDEKIKGWIEVIR